MAEIRIHYEIRLSDGSTFDSSRARGEPMTIDGDNPPFPEAVANKVRNITAGEKLTIELTSDKAYGPRDDELIFELEKTKLPDDFKPEIGGMVTIGLEGEELLTTLIEDREETVILDANHPLAGQDLVFIIEGQS